MPVTTTQAIVSDAAAGTRAALAVNIVTLEQAEGALIGADRVGAPIILQISENAVLFHDGALRPLAAATRAAIEDSPVTASLHFDHVTRPDLVRAAAAAGFSSVMVDASGLPYAENLALTKQLTDELHDSGLHVEAELGEIGGKDGAHAPGVRTDPDEAARFVADTGVDALAVAVGSSHAMNERTARLDHDLIARIKQALGIPLVLHGSSGVPPAEMRAAVAAGMTKINVGTLLGAAFTAAVRGALRDGTEIVDPRKFLRPARLAVADAVEECLRDLAVP